MRRKPESRPSMPFLDVTEPMGMETLIYFPCTAPRSAAGSIPMPAPGTVLRSDWLWTSTICIC